MNASCCFAQKWLIALDLPACRVALASEQEASGLIHSGDSQIARRAGIVVSVTPEDRRQLEAIAGDRKRAAEAIGCASDPALDPAR